MSREGLEKLLWFFLLLGLFLSGQKGVWAQAEQVERVEVQLSLEGNSLYQDLAERISLALQTVGERVLIGLPVRQVEANAPALATVINQVFSKVLLGFRVEAVTLTPGVTTKLELALAVAGPTIENVVVRINAEGINPRLAGMLDANTPLFSELGQRVLAGLPLAAFTWAQGVAELVLEQVVKTQLPGFAVNLKLALGTTTQIELHLAPQREQVARVRVNLASDSLPPLLLARYQKEAEALATSLIGIPIPFLQRYQQEITGEITALVNQQLKQWGLMAVVVLEPRELTTVNVQIESKWVRLHLDVELNIGTDAPAPALNSGLGLMLGQRQELFLQNHLRLTQLSSEWQVGLGVQFGQGTWGGAVYTLSTRAWELWFAHLASQMTLNVTADIWQGTGSVAIGTQLNQYTRLEVVGDLQRRYWLRLTGHI